MEHIILCAVFFGLFWCFFIRAIFIVSTVYYRILYTFLSQKIEREHTKVLMIPSLKVTLHQKHWGSEG